MMPEFLKEAKKLIDAHNGDTEAHPFLQDRKSVV